MRNFFLITPLLITSIIFEVSCKEAEFDGATSNGVKKSATSAKLGKPDETDPTPNPTDSNSPTASASISTDPNASPTDFQDPTPSVTPTPTTPPNEAAKCTAGHVTFAGNGFGTMCPAQSTAYAADDGSVAFFACCALPTTDILLAGSTPTLRSVCGEDELVVGASGNSMYCQKIDTTKYKLTGGPAACYYGSGAAGSKGGGPCNNTSSALINALGARFGSDGCIASPGSVVHGRSGKDCGNIPTRHLQTIDGVAVAFPY